jgi:hypothetical protein
MAGELMEHGNWVLAFKERIEAWDIEPRKGSLY